MKLLVIRGDLRSHSGYAAAARDYCRELARCCERLVGVDIHYAPERSCEPFPYPLVTDDEARRLAAGPRSTLVLSFTTPDRYVRFPGAVNVGLTFWETDRLPLKGQAFSPWAAQANQVDAIWAPSTYTRQVFESAGVRVPIRVIPWPFQVPERIGPGLPDGEIYDLDDSPRLADPLIRLAWFHLGGLGWFSRYANPRAAARFLDGLRTSSAAIADPGRRALLCVAQDAPRKALPLLLAEWLEFKKRQRTDHLLIIKSSPLDPHIPRFEFVVRFWQQVQALKRRLKQAEAGILLWTGDLAEPDYQRLVGSTAGHVVTSLGEGFCGPAALALALRKPLVAPRHTAFLDYLPEDYPYAYATGPAPVRFVRDPLRVYDPASLWNVPAPFAIAQALARMTSASLAERARAATEARARLFDWCDAGRVRIRVNEELERLRACAAAA